MFHFRSSALSAVLAAVLLATFGCVDIDSTAGSTADSATGTQYRSLIAMHGQLATMSPTLTHQWPASVPTFTSGDFVLATAHGSGSATALWQTTHVARTALQLYHARLLAQGFQSVDVRVIGEYYVRDYRDSRSKVRVIAHRLGDITELTVTVRSA